MSRKVKINFTLVGKACPDFKPLKDLTNKEIFYWIENQIQEHFGKERPLFFPEEKSLLMEGRKYPNFYSAGWFVSDDPITNSDGVGSELVVIGHGENMKTAQSAMMKAAGNTDWDNLAKNI